MSRSPGHREAAQFGSTEACRLLLMEAGRSGQLMDALAVDRDRNSPSASVDLEPASDLENAGNEPPPVVHQWYDELVNGENGRSWIMNHPSLGSLKLLKMN